MSGLDWRVESKNISEWNYKYLLSIYYMPGSFPGRRYILVPPTKMSSPYLYKPQRKLGKKRVTGN